MWQSHLASSPPEKDNFPFESNLLAMLHCSVWTKQTRDTTVGMGVPCIWIGQWSWSFQIAWAEWSCQYENKIELIINLLGPEFGEMRCWHPANEKVVNFVAVWHTWIVAQTEPPFEWREQAKGWDLNPEGGLWEGWRLNCLTSGWCLPLAISISTDTNVRQRNSFKSGTYVLLVSSPFWGNTVVP